MFRSSSSGISSAPNSVNIFSGFLSEGAEGSLSSVTSSPDRSMISDALNSFIIRSSPSSLITL